MFIRYPRLLTSMYPHRNPIQLIRSAPSVYDVCVGRWIDSLYLELRLPSVSYPLISGLCLHSLAGNHCGIVCHFYPYTRGRPVSGSPGENNDLNLIPSSPAV